MPLFFYTARNKKGMLMQGTIDALSTQAARDSLQEMKLTVEELHEATMQEKLTLGAQATTETPSLPEKLEEPVVEKLAKGWSDEADQAAPVKTTSNYYSLVDTLRLYAGWLIAYHVLVYALASYQRSRDLTFTIPFVDGLMLSSLVLSFTFASFLFLLLTTLHKLLGGGRMRGWGFVILGVLLFVYYEMNI